MIDEFENLEEQDVELLLQAPILVCILIAGADDKIDRSELKEAVNVAQSKQKKARRTLLEYYRIVGEDFEDKLKFMINRFPATAKERNPQIVSELEKLNDILAKIDAGFARELYASLRDVAKKIAEASGGILGYMSIGYEESKFIDLKMINDPSKS